LPVYWHVGGPDSVLAQPRLGDYSNSAVRNLGCLVVVADTGERITGGTIVTICGHLGNLMSSYFFPDSDLLKLTMAMFSQIVFAG
jgi:hypothetical protein